MTITYEVTLRQFKARHGAVITKEAIIKADKDEEFDALMEDIYPEGMTEAEYNDLLWFEADWIAESLGMRTQSDIDSDIESVEAKLEYLDEGTEEYEEAMERLQELRDEEPEI